MKPFEIKFTVTPKEKELMQTILLDYFSTQVEEEHLDLILEEDPCYRGEVIKFGVTNDTSARRTLIDAFTSVVLGMDDDWPMNGDSAKYSVNFYSEYAKKCKELNIKTAIT